MIDEAETLRVVQRHKESAKSHTSFGDLDAALDELDQAIGVLEELGGDWLTVGADRAAPPSEVTDPQLVAGQYSDLLAMRGGVLRRKGDDVEALKSYVDGSRFELDERYGVMNSYATVNALKMIELGRIQLPAEHAGPTVEDAIEMVEAQVDAGRQQDRWAWADLGDLYLMKGDGGAALDAYRTFAELSTEDHLATACSVLQDLEAALRAPPEDPRSDAVGEVVAYLEELID